MNSTPKNLAKNSPEAHIKGLLEWLALAHEHTGGKDAAQLYQQILLLREAAIPTAQRIEFLDLLYAHAVRIANTERVKLRRISLPVSRKDRQRMKPVQDILATLTQDYFNTLAELFDPEITNTLRTPHISLCKAMNTIAWQIKINHLLAAPPNVGLWQQLHAAFRSASRLGLEDLPIPHDQPSIRQTYTNTLLAGIAHPASFSSAELEFISDYIESTFLSIDFASTPPLDSTGLFWIDLSNDFPACALARRMPAANLDVLYFSCNTIASAANQHRAALEKEIPAATLGLPVFAETHAGKGVLQRLNRLWGHPSKRKFSRRKQSYRAKLCAGLNPLWHLLKTPTVKTNLSEWMVTNESPDGYSLMHIAGQTEGLHVGDIVALQPTGERAEASPLWHTCIIRWAISENPEHIELGLELLAPQAIAAEITHPVELTAGKIAALILPETLPLRKGESLVVPTGVLKEDTRRIILVVEKDNLEIREIRTSHLAEQTSTIEVFSVLPDNSS